MFRCYFCQQVTPPKTTRHSIVIETREKKYSSRRREPKRRQFRNREDTIEDRGGSGTEILREVDACPTCAAKQQTLAPVVTTVSSGDEVTQQESSSQ